MINLKQNYEIIFSNKDAQKKTLWNILSKNKTLLYFYPKDNTPGCTIENKDFSQLKNKFSKKWITVIWVSKDSIESHKKFIEKQNLNIDLISDPELILHKELWVYWEKNNYWKIVQGVIRSTFLVNKNWEILEEYRNIKAKWHAERLLKELV